MEISSIENSNLHIQIKNLNVGTTHRKSPDFSGDEFEYTDLKAAAY